MSVRLLLRCGCAITFAEHTPPVCVQHGDVGVVRTIGSPAPRIRGVARGPHVQTMDLPAHVGVIEGVVPMKDGSARRG